MSERRDAAFKAWAEANLPPSLRSSKRERDRTVYLMVHRAFDAGWAKYEVSLGVAKEQKKLLRTK